VHGDGARLILSPSNKVADPIAYAWITKFSLFYIICRMGVYAGYRATFL
jgi:hypothetical protein